MKNETVLQNLTSKATKDLFFSSGWQNQGNEDKFASMIGKSCHQSFDKILNYNLLTLTLETFHFV